MKRLQMSVPGGMILTHPLHQSLDDVNVAERDNVPVEWVAVERIAERLAPHLPPTTCWQVLP